MADFTRDQVADIVNETTVDNNLKLADGADPPIVELAQEGDEFGINYDAVHWVIEDDYYNQAFAGNTWTEAGGLIIPDLKAGIWRSAQKRLFTYGDADIFAYISNTQVANTSLLSQVELLLWRDVDNSVSFSYRPRLGPNQDFIIIKWINRVATTLKQTIVGPKPQLWLRIKRRLTSGPANNYFDFYYATADPVAVPANWILYHSAQITAASFNNTHLLYPLLANYANTGDNTFQPERDYYRQKIDDGVVAQRFWNDSPECDIINSAAGAVEYAFDAGFGNMWRLVSATCIKSEPGTSTVKFKLGYSNTGLDADVTWVDAVWQTIAQVSANALAGLYDSHRYLHIQVQFNSGGTDQPNLHNFIITGTVISVSKRHHNMMRRIKYGMSRLG